jgi:hypothetical protein
MDGSGMTGAVMIDIDAELSCWRQLEGPATSEFVFLFHEWEPAIRVGIHAYLAYPDRDFDSLEPVIVAAYQRIRGRSRIPWTRAAPAAKRVWQKLHDDSLRDHRLQDAGVGVRDDSLHGDGVLDDSPVAGVTRLMARA